MSALIKHGDDHGLQRVRPVAMPGHTPPKAAVVDGPSPGDIRIAELEAALRDVQSRHDAAQRQHAIDLEKAHQSAHAEGLAAGRSESEALLAAIGDAASAARASAREALAGASTTALMLARSALGKILGDTDQWPAMIAGIIAQRSADIDAALLLLIRVSAADFPDPDTLSRVAGSDEAIKIAADSKLESGRCVFALRLGDMEVGPALQGPKLLAFFDDLAARGDGQ